MYTDLIDGFDTRNKQIYMHKLTKAIELSINTVEQRPARRLDPLTRTCLDNNPSRITNAGAAKEQ